jgi:hypothetical protein
MREARCRGLTTRAGETPASPIEPQGAALANPPASAASLWRPTRTSGAGLDVLSFELLLNPPPRLPAGEDVTS